MAGRTTNGTAPRKKINWLKGLLDGEEDSSDATPQRKEQDLEMSSNADRKLKKKKKVHKARSIARGDAVPGERQARQESDKKKYHKGRHGAYGDDILKHDPLHAHHLRKIHVAPLSGTKDGAGEKRRREYLEDKAGKMARKRPHAYLEIKGIACEKEKAVGLQLKGSIDPAKAKAAALRQRRMRKLQARRKATGELERLAAVKLKRLEISEAARLKRNQSEQIRKAQKAPVGVGTDQKVRYEGNIRPRSAPLSTEETKERQRLAAKKQLGGLKSTSISGLKRPRTAGSEKERQRRKEGLLHALENKAELRQKRKKLEFVKEDVESAAGITPVKYSEMVESLHADGMQPEDTTVSDISREHGARSSRDINNVDGPESQEQSTQNDEPCRTVICEETKEEGQVDSPAPTKNIAAIVKPQDKSEEATSDDVNEVALDMAPIPRKSIKDTSSAASFLIPKRSVINTDGKVEARGMTQATSYNDHKPRIPVSAKPLSLESSSRLSSRDPIRSQQERKKIPVPMKDSVLSAHDKALMRLARKRNSVFLAAGELAAQPSLVGSKLSAARMTGYDVFDAGGKVLLDLVPRWSCAAKREMVANKDSCAAPFFGASLAAPKAKGGNSQTADEGVDVECRMMNCYEELRFQRPEDREFYLRRMYGTVFVPQHLRGRATLIVRYARFERKSTGIRFNQDRDREEFASSLSKRYTFKQSAPRCEIRRENWQKLMRNQPSVVYLHYNNVEDAERASHVFRDDAGNALELKPEHSSCVSSGRGFFPANGNGYRTPRRSCSSEQSPPMSLLQSSQGSSVRNTPRWQREHQNATIQYPRYDWPPSPQRKGREYRYNLSASEYRLRSRSRSRSRPKRFPGQQHDSVGKGGGGETDVVTGVVGTSTRGVLIKEKAGGNTEPQVSNDPSAGDQDEATMNERSALPMVPPPRAASQVKKHREQDLESGEEEQEEGEIECSIEPMAEATDRFSGREGSLCNRRRSWEQRSAVQDYCGRPYEQNYNLRSDRRRSRSRSRTRPRQEGRAAWGRGRRDDSWDVEERFYRDYGPAKGSDNGEYGRRIYSGEIGRYSGRNYRDGGYNNRTGDASLRPY